MKLLFFSQVAWDNKNSVGNTYSNWFDGEVWKNDSFSHIYTRKKKPDNRMNISYYNISAIDAIKGFLTGKNKGTIFSVNPLTTDKMWGVVEDCVEQIRIDLIHKKKHDFVYYVHELLWRSRLWLDYQLKNYISNIHPDILFAFATNPYILWPLIQYLQKNTQCKVVLLIADDVYGSYDDCAFYRKVYLKREFEKCIHAADKLYGISDEMSKLYEIEFGKCVETLYKGCDLSIEPKQHLNRVLRFVYAGNLFWGRDDTLASVASSLENLNQNGLKATLEIYTGATATEQLKDKLNRGVSSQIMGARSYEEIKKIMHEADVVLHVESFEEEAIKKVRSSFSTKIIDCLQSGNQVLAIGPKEIASIEYLRKVDGVIVVDDQKQVLNVVKHIVLHSEEININRHRTREYAQKYHEISKVQVSIRSDVEELLHV